MKIVAYTITGEHQLDVRFSDGKIISADFTEFLQKNPNPLIRKFLDPTLFKTVSLDEYGVLTWGDNEMDINPISIYTGAFNRQLRRTI
ncbi:hypothetical protein GCM10028805_61640 [Spirosoma harenae]